MLQKESLKTQPNVTNTTICVENLKPKFWNLSQSDTAWEESVDLAAPCLLPCHTRDSAPESWRREASSSRRPPAHTTDVPPIGSVYRQRCDVLHGSLARERQQWQEKIGCLSGGERHRNVPKRMPGLPREGSFRSHWFALHVKAVEVSVRKHWALDGRISAGIAGWQARLVTPRVPTYASPRQSSVTSDAPSLKNNNDKKKARKLHVLQSLIL